jgi:hypothetical protein
MCVCGGGGHVCCRKTLLPPRGIAYRNVDTSPLLPHKPSPALGCLPVKGAGGRARGGGSKGSSNENWGGGACKKVGTPHCSTETITSIGVLACQGGGRADEGGGSKGSSHENGGRGGGGHVRRWVPPHCCPINHMGCLPERDTAAREGRHMHVQLSASKPWISIGCVCIEYV